LQLLLLEFRNRGCLTHRTLCDEWASRKNQTIQDVYDALNRLTTLTNSLTGQFSRVPETMRVPQSFAHFANDWVLVFGKTLDRTTLDFPAPISETSTSLGDEVLVVRAIIAMQTVVTQSESSQGLECDGDPETVARVTKPTHRKVRDL
jgi:hypothetical protein